MRNLLFVAFFFLVIQAVSATSATWVFGNLPDVQSDYENYVRQVANYFDQWYDKTEILSEQDFDIDQAKGDVLFAGPVQAFTNLSVLNLPFETDKSTITVNGTTFEKKRTGIFLRNRDMTVFLYTGLSYQGFRDIFAVNTGEEDFKAVIDCIEDSIGNYGEAGLEIKPTPFADPYPTSAQLENLEVSEAILNTHSILDQDNVDSIPENLSLSWLKEKIENSKVIFFGEQHWSGLVNDLCTTTAISLAKSHGLRGLILELEYSRSGYYNYFVTETNEQKANDFFNTCLTHLVADASTENMLRLVRKYNMNNRNSMINVGCNDLEWGLRETMNIMIEPYFKKVNPEFSLSGLSINDMASSKDFILKLENLLDKASQEQIIGDYPFLTPTYMHTVVSNISSLFDNWFGINTESIRQKAIIRNLTDEKYNGWMFDSQLVMIYGGAWHGVKAPIEPDPEVVRDAEYLHNTYKKTKGRVFSMSTSWLGVSFKNAAALDPDTLFSGADTYNRWINRFHKFKETGNTDLNQYYCMNGVNLFSAILAKHGMDTNANVLGFESIDWKKLSEKFNKDFSEYESDYKLYDYNVMVLRSNLMALRKKPTDSRKNATRRYSLPKIRKPGLSSNTI